LTLKNTLAQIPFHFYPRTFSPDRGCPFSPLPLIVVDCVRMFLLTTLFQTHDPEFPLPPLPNHTTLSPRDNSPSYFLTFHDLFTPSVPWTPFPFLSFSIFREPDSYLICLFPPFFSVKLIRCVVESLLSSPIRKGRMPLFFPVTIFVVMISDFFSNEGTSPFIRSTHPLIGAPSFFHRLRMGDFFDEAGISVPFFRIKRCGWNSFCVALPEFWPEVPDNFRTPTGSFDEEEADASPLSASPFFPHVRLVGYGDPLSCSHLSEHPLFPFPLATTFSSPLFNSHAVLLSFGERRPLVLQCLFRHGLAERIPLSVS